MSEHVDPRKKAAVKVQLGIKKLQSSLMDGESSKQLEDEGRQEIIKTIVELASAELGHPDNKDAWRTRSPEERKDHWETVIAPEVFAPAEQELAQLVVDALSSTSREKAQEQLLVDYPDLTPDMIPSMSTMASGSFRWKGKFVYKNREYRLIPNSAGTYKNAIKNAYVRGDLNEAMSTKNELATGKKTSSKTEEERFEDDLRRLGKRIRKQPDLPIATSWCNEVIEQMQQLLSEL